MLIKRFFPLLILAFFCTLAVNAQTPEKKSHAEMRKEVAEFKIKFLAQEMELKDNQREQFAELYTKMDQEKRQAFSKAMKLERKVKNDKEATEADYAAAAKAMEEARDKDHEIDKKYDEKFATFLSAKQRFKMRSAEEQFRKKMEQMHRERKSQKRSNHNHGSK